MGSLWEDLESLVEAPSSFTAKAGERGTVKAKVAFNADEDAKALRKAMKGLGTDEKTLTDILAHRSSAQRQLICAAYQKATSRMLLKDLKDETSGDFKDLLVALVTPPAEYDCHEVMRAIKGVGTEGDVLVEIFSSRSNQEIKALTEAFLKETQKQLTTELEKKVSGDFSKALLLLAQGNREQDTSADVEKAREDAKTLYSAGEKKWGTDEAKFIEILCRKSIPQIRQTLVEYKNISGKTLQQSIEAEMSGNLRNLLVAVVKCVKSQPAYFAECLHNSMKGGGTHESTLTRIMVTRSEIDLLDIRAEFKKLYNHSLQSALQSEVSGDYGDCLKAICGGDD
ncbi:Annexin A3 [Oryzias melastigma]|uniref:Annexin n=1 Tax=Oryzias melastigma TaxID=30732 RepID=A0A3B3E1V7_ORYME|nr:annexin A3 [Oryzias melastigma]KAF6733687.1 Annexin A3 [Oryzias melastigma]